MGLSNIVPNVNCIIAEFALKEMTGRLIYIKQLLKRWILEYLLQVFIATNMTPSFQDCFAALALHAIFASEWISLLQPWPLGES